MSTAIGAVDPRALSEARVVIHWAAQLFHGVGEAFVGAAPDYSHSNLLWRADTGRFVSRPFGEGARLFLEPAGLVAGLVDAGGGEVYRLSLVGLDLKAAMAEVAVAVAEQGIAVPAEGLPWPTWDLPAHPIADGGPFTAPDPSAARALGAWFALAAELLEGVAAAHPSASEVRCWPHHFDIATLIGVDEEAHEEHARSVGVGLSPGDGAIEQPYFYVTPWPPPKDHDALPALTAGGQWHIEGFVAVVIRGEQVTAIDEGEQRDWAKAALAEAVKVAFEVVGA